MSDDGTTFDVRVYRTEVCKGAEPATARRMLDLATGTVDGRNAAASTARRHRIILANAMDYGVDLGLLETNPIRVLKWTVPKVSSQVDKQACRRSYADALAARLAPLRSVPYGAL